MDNPFAPITPDQEQAIKELAAKLPRRQRENVERGLPGLDVERATELLRRLKGEPAPAVVVAPPADQLATRAANAALRDKLDAGYAGHTMKAGEKGLVKPSLFAGYTNTPAGTLT